MILVFLWLAFLLNYNKMNGDLDIVAKIGVFKDGLWYLDLNGNGAWDGASEDKAYKFGERGYIEVLGDWNGDGRTEIGAFYQGSWYLDSNGDGRWDKNLDKLLIFGRYDDIPVAGDWDGDGKSDIGIFRKGEWHLLYYYYKDKNKSGYLTTICSFGAGQDIPITGDWNGDGKTEIGVFREGRWYLDYNGDGKWNWPEKDKKYYSGNHEQILPPGDRAGDGRTKFGAFINRKKWLLDFNGNGLWDGTATDKSYVFGASGAGFIPVVGDWNGDGKTEIGIFLNGNWYLDSNGNGRWDGTATDKAYHFGSPGYRPVVGRW